MIHVHACVRGGYIPQRVLSREAAHAGFGRVADIRAAGVGHAGYASKVVWYAAKSSRDGEGWASAMDLNGGRLWHWSRGYTEGLTLRAFVARYAPVNDPGPWVPASMPANHRL